MTIRIYFPNTLFVGKRNGADGTEACPETDRFRDASAWVEQLGEHAQNV
jgi:hypothetical protein